MKVVLGSAKPETAMSGVAAYPASGSFVDVSGYEWAHIVAHLGTIHASDTPVLEPKCSDSASGTLDRIDATLAHTCDVSTDDGDVLVWSIEVRKLALDHHFLALATSGTLTNGSYIDVMFYLEGGSQPVTQPATVVGDYMWLG
jgi:hypothetical protein